MAVVCGLLLGSGRQPASYGWTMFVILPTALGIVVGCFSRGLGRSPGHSLRIALVTGILSIIACFLFLLLTGFEGLICVLMAFPLIFFSLAVGALAVFVWESRIDRRQDGQPNLVLVPLACLATVFGAKQIENRLATGERVQTISTSRTVSGTPEEVWHKILAIHEIAGSKPFLLRIGLPVPKSCTLEGTGVGARRVCHFDTGVIEEEVTAWEPGRRLDVCIVRSTLPGRHWLGLVGACYQLEPLPGRETRLTRTTTMSSMLRPGWYWRHPEAMAVQAEHRYLFDSLFRD